MKQFEPSCISHVFLIKPYSVMLELVKNIIAELGAIKAKNMTVMVQKSVNKQNFNTKQRLN